MKRQSIGGKPKHLGDLAGRHAGGAGFDEHPKYVEPVVLRERRERCDGIGLFHISTNIETKAVSQGACRCPRRRCGSFAQNAVVDFWATRSCKRRSPRACSLVSGAATL